VSVTVAGIIFPPTVVLLLTIDVAEDEAGVTDVIAFGEVAGATAGPPGGVLGVLDDDDDDDDEEVEVVDEAAAAAAAAAAERTGAKKACFIAS
jgi:hypothetical protein